MEENERLTETYKELAAQVASAKRVEEKKETGRKKKRQEDFIMDDFKENESNEEGQSSFEKPEKKKVN
jgi:hypothetical protein